MSNGKTAARLCLQVDCYDYDDDGDHDLIGSFSTTVEELIKATTIPVSSGLIYSGPKWQKSIAVVT